jgi:hypothetical protein
MSSNVDDIRRRIATCEEEIRRYEVRAALATSEAWRLFIAEKLEDVVGLDRRLLEPPAKPGQQPLTPYWTGVLQGRRQIIASLMFSPEEVQKSLAAERAKLQDLRAELAEWQTKAAYRNR